MENAMRMHRRTPLQQQYWRVEEFAFGSPKTWELSLILKTLCVVSPASQQRLQATIDRASDPANAARRLFLIACREANQELVEFLRAQCDINAVDEEGNSALIQAAQSGQYPTFRYLVDQGADPHAGDSKAPLLRAAISGGSLAILDLVVELVGDGDMGEVLENNTRLFLDTVMKDRVPLASLLLAHGATARTEDIATNNLLWKAVRSLEMAHLLYDNGADFGRGIVGSDLVVEAAHLNNIPLLKFYLDHGADIRRMQYRSSSPIHCASIYRRTDLMKLFASHGVDMDAQLEDGSTALHKCFGHEQTHRLLVELGADVTIRSSTGVDSSFRGAQPWEEPMNVNALWASKQHLRPPPPA